MIHHYQEELNAFVEKAAEFFGLTSVGIYGQFIVMLGTISFLRFGEATNLFVIPNYDWLTVAGIALGVTAKFFTTCVGAIATFKFVSQVSRNILNYFKKKKDANNSTDNK
jgi:hypothetical protein